MQYFFINKEYLAQKNVLLRNPHIFQLAGISQSIHNNAKWNNSALLDTTDLILKPLAHAWLSSSSNGLQILFVRDSLSILCIKCLNGWNQSTFNMNPWVHESFL